MGDQLMTRDELLIELRKIDPESSEEGHMEADALLVVFINDPEIAEAYGAIGKWYA